MKNVRVIASTVPVLLASVLLAAPAEAGERFTVELADVQNFVGVPGTFTSNIPGCPTGRSYDVRGMVRFGPDVFRGTRMFVCDSGIGSFTLSLSARFGEFGSVGTWSVVAGTEDFSRVHGAGRLVGTPVEDGIQDNYTGTVTVVG
jgi:hypothetical protein